jgi:hypothetical protein
MKIVRDQRSSLIARHAGLVTVLALATVAIGLLMGFGAVELYEAANGWLLYA